MQSFTVPSDVGAFNLLSIINIAHTDVHIEAIEITKPSLDL